MDERHPSQSSFAPGNSGNAGAPGAYGPLGAYGVPDPYGAPAAPGGYGPAPGAAGFPPNGYGQAAYDAAGYPAGGYGQPPYGAPGMPPGFPPELIPPGYNPWLGAYAGPRYASVWARIAAYFVDSLVLGVVNVVAYLTVIVATTTTTTDQAGAPTVPPMAMLAAIILVLVLDGIYFVAQEGSSGQTIGKRVLGIKVVKADGGEMTVDAALVRYLFLLLAGLGLGGLITVLMISLSDTKQRIGDRVAGTIVVKAG